MLPPISPRSDPSRPSPRQQRDPAASTTLPRLSATRTPRRLGAREPAIDSNDKPHIGLAQFVSYVLALGGRCRIRSTRLDACSQLASTFVQLDSNRDQFLSKDQFARVKAMLEFPSTPSSYLSAVAFLAAMRAYCRHLLVETTYVEDAVTGVRVATAEQRSPIHVVLPKNEAEGYPAAPSKVYLATESTREKIKRQKAMKAMKASTYGQVNTLLSLVPIILAPSEHAHKGMLLVLTAASGGGKTWAATQLSHELAARAAETAAGAAEDAAAAARSADDADDVMEDVPLVPLLLSVQKLAPLLKRDDETGAGAGRVCGRASHAVHGEHWCTRCCNLLPYKIATPSAHTLSLAPCRLCSGCHTFVCYTSLYTRVL